MITLQPPQLQQVREPLVVLAMATPETTTVETITTVETTTAATITTTTETTEILAMVMLATVPETQLALTLGSAFLP